MLYLTKSNSALNVCTNFFLKQLNLLCKIGFKLVEKCFLMRFSTSKVLSIIGLSVNYAWSLDGPLLRCQRILFRHLLSLFTDPLFSLQSPSSARDKK